MSDGESPGDSVLLFLRLWTYGGPAQPLSGLALEQDPEIAELIREIIHNGKAELVEQQPELWSARFDNPLHALSAAKALQRRFLTFHRKVEPQQVVPSILIYPTKNEGVSGPDSAAPEDMLANVTSAQILVSESIYVLAKSTPGFQFNPKPVREAGETFSPEAIYELLWTDESTYGHLRQASRSGLDQVGRYQIQEELGRGAMGAVYKAFDQLIGRTVALKTISIDRNTPDRDDLIERLKQEAKAAGGLDHPNIITIYDVAQEGDVVYLSMQFVEGKTLLTLLAEDGVPSLQTFISWADQISSAVGYAHAHGVIHRDLKPANIMLTNQGVVKVLDFGIAKVGDSSLTQTGLVVGTPSYMAPEQVVGKKVDHRADIFALGSVFYELVTSEKAFKGDITTILYKIVNEDPVAPSIINPAVPGGIDAIIRQALAKEPNERFQSCDAMRNAFLEQGAQLRMASLVSVPARAVDAKPAPHPPAAFPHYLLEDSTPQRRTRIWPTVAAGLALLLIGTAGWAFYTRSQTGSFPPAVKKLASTFQHISPAEPSNRVKPEELAGKHTDSDASDRSEENAVNNPASAGANSGTQSSGAPSDNAQKTQTQVASASTGSSTVPPQEAAAGQSSAATLGTPLPAQTQVPQNPSTSGQSVIALPPQPSDKNQPATESASAPGAAATNGDSANAPVTLDADESQADVAPPTAKPLKKRISELALTVDGFTRRDVPELLRQADAATGRGDYRLAGYEYSLILKLDRSNATARAGLHRVQAAQQSR